MCVNCREQTSTEEVSTTSTFKFSPPSHEHYFVKFDKTRIFCETCGEFRLAKITEPTTLPNTITWPYPYTSTKPWTTITY